MRKEIREHEKQAAQELGQWVEKGAREISGPGGGAIPFEAMVEKVYGKASAEKGGRDHGADCHPASVGP